MSYTTPAPDQRSAVTISATMSAYAALAALLSLQALLLISADTECPPSRKQEPNDETKLLRDLRCGYVSENRPVKNYRNTVEVKVRLSIKYMSFDSLEEIFTIHSWVAMVWKDEYLIWTPSDYGDIKEIQMESHTIWTPSMSLFNADAASYPTDSFYSTCMVNNEGTVTCVPHVSHSGICQTSLRRWPYDVQNCTFYFGSWMHSGEQVNFTLYPTQAVILDDYHDGPGWKLLNVDSVRLPGKYSCCPNDTHPILKYTFVLKREAAGPAAIVIVPSIVVVLLTLTSLLMDVKDNTRLMLACFSLFGHFTFLTEIGYDIPKHSTGTPIILLFLRDSMILTLTSILVTLLLMALRKRTVPAPSWIVKVVHLVSRGPGKYVMFTEFEAYNAGDIKILTEDGAGSNSNEEEQNASANWLQFANLINSCVFIISVLVYLILIINYIPYDD